jgi:hypothetical protein
MKQFIVDRHTTPNTPKMDEVPNEKIPIYDSLADAEADLANLTEGQIVATKDTGDELAQPVNVVESGNLHAVSSNAVYETINRQIKPHKYSISWGNVTSGAQYSKTISEVTNGAITTQDECYGISCLSNGGSLGYDTQDCITVTLQNTILYTCRLTQNNVVSRIVLWF